MAMDTMRLESIQEGLGREKLDAVVCALPVNVLLLSGYWPVVGTSIAVVTREGKAVVLVPEDEAELAGHGWGQVRTFRPGSLENLQSAGEAARRPLGEILAELNVDKGRIGYEAAAAFEPASYASMHLYMGDLARLVQSAAGKCQLQAADGLLARLKAVKTSAEIDRIRQGGLVARMAFRAGAQGVRVGVNEAEAAAGFSTTLNTLSLREPGVQRGGGFVFCMSGPNSAQAFGAYARSRARRLGEGDLVLVHCNSYLDGYWTDITRTYTLGRMDERKQGMYEAVFAARGAALAAVRPGAKARDVDGAARRVLGERGFGEQFKHGTGHGVGFAAINHLARPRIHPASDDVLEEGMVFNIEPAIYVEGYGGMRHCDMVLVSGQGHELLTPFQEHAMEVG